MKKLLAILAIIFLPTKAMAVTCNYYMVDGCSAYTKGLTDVLAMNTLYFTLNSGTYKGVDVEFSSWTIPEFQNAAPDVSVSQLPVILINAVKDLNAKVAGTRTFNYPSRALNSCFQISATKDSDFHYKVDVTNALSLTTGAQGTITVTSYTNSGCTTGAQAIADGTASQTGTLVVGLALNQISSVSLDGTVPANKWVKITTTNTVGTPTFSIRAVQSEVIQP